jgi:hypothetical protein
MSSTQYEVKINQDKNSSTYLLPVGIVPYMVGKSGRRDNGMMISWGDAQRIAQQAPTCPVAQIVRKYNQNQS